MRDSTYFLYCILFFGTLGLVLPILQGDINFSGNTSHTIRGTTALANGGSLVAVGSFFLGDSVAVGVFANILTIGFWSYAFLPAWMDVLIMLPIQAYFVVVCVKWIRGVSS